MAKGKIKGDGENKKQVKFGLNCGIIIVRKGSKIIKSNLQPNPTMATKPSAQSLDGDSAISLGSLFKCLTTLSMKKFSLISKKIAHHYCQMSFVIRALVWREGRALQGHWIGAGRSWEQRHTRFQPCPCGGWSVWTWGLFQGVPKCSEVSQQLRIRICHLGHLEGTGHQCPNIYRSRGAPALPAHPQQCHSKSDLKSHSLGRVWSFLHIPDSAACLELAGS